MTIGHRNDPPVTISGSITVTAAPPSITLATPSSVVYGHAATFSATATGFGTPTGTVSFYSGPVNSADLIGTGTLSEVERTGSGRLAARPSLTAAGSPYMITAVYSGDANNQGSRSNPVTQTITPAPLTITVNSQSRVYGQANPALTVGYSGFVDGDTAASLTTQPSASTTATTGSPVGSYMITASGAVDANYTIGYTSGTLQITPAALTITANNQSDIYGQANPALTVRYSGFVNSDTAASLTTQPSVSTTATTGSPVGSYTITASGAVDANYTICYTSGTLQITPAALTITANSLSKVYGQANPCSLSATRASSTATPQPA